MRAALRKVARLPFEEQSAAKVPVIGPERNATEQTDDVVLLVSRDNQSKQWAPRWLQQEGFSVEIAGTLDEAIQLLSRIEPAVVIADANRGVRGHS